MLFADLKGSMELLADRDPEEARKLLDPVLERMMEAVHRYEGTVNQVMGDGIMALFGAPLAHEDHAVRACYAALRMQERVRRYAEEVRRAHGMTVQIRVGLNSGEVVVRAIGSDLRMDYTAVGQTTHLAARMEQLADPGSDPADRRHARAGRGLRPGQAARPGAGQGLDGPGRGLRADGAGPAAVAAPGGGGAGADALRRARRRAGAAPPGARPRGRRATARWSPWSASRAWASRGSSGSSPTPTARRAGWSSRPARSPTARRPPTCPVIDLLRGYFQIESRDDPRKIREKVTGKLLTLDAGAGARLPALLALLDVPVDDAAWQALDPPQRRQRTLDAVKRLLLRESQVQPLLVVFEDLHWIDGETQALLDSLVESLPAARILLLVNYRPEYQHGWGGKTYYRQLRLDPLPPESADELLEALLGADPALGPLKRLLVERTEGNPFFLEESVRALVETGALAGERGAYRLTQPVDAADRSPPRCRRSWPRASTAWRPRPSACSRRPRSSARTCRCRCSWPSPTCRSPRCAPRLARLQAAEFLYETRLFPDLEYTFKHALTHEVAYQGLLHERRRALHARIVEAIERLSPERARRAGRAAGPPRPARGAVGEGGRLSPPGGAPGHGAGGQPRGRGPPGAGARGPPPSPRDPGDDRADHRPPPRPPERAPPARRVGRAWGTTSTRRRCSPGRSATRTGSRGSPPSW